MGGFSRVTAHSWYFFLFFFSSVLSLLLRDPRWNSSEWKQHVITFSFWANSHVSPTKANIFLDNWSKYNGRAILFFSTKEVIYRSREGRLEQFGLDWHYGVYFIAHQFPVCLEFELDFWRGEELKTYIWFVYFFFHFKMIKLWIPLQNH